MITCTNELTTDDYKRILTDSLASPIHQYDNMIFNSIGVHVDISETAADYIAQQANMTQIGARGLSQTITEFLTPAIYTLTNDNSISRITLDFNQNGLYVNQEQGPRPVKKDYRQHGHISAPIPVPTLFVPFLSNDCLIRIISLFIYCRYEKQVNTLSRRLFPRFIPKRRLMQLYVY